MLIHVFECGPKIILFVIFKKQNKHFFVRVHFSF